MAGEKGLSRIIEYVTVMEVPDVIKWLKGNDLLLTSLYPIKDDPQAIANLVRNLHQIGSSALAIKTHQFFDEIPSVILEEGDRYHFPIIRISPDISYIDIMTPLVERILEEKGLSYQETDELLNVITELALEGRGINEITQALSNFFKNPVTVESELPLSDLPKQQHRIEPLNALQLQELRKSNRPIRMKRRLDERLISCIVSPIMIHKSLYGVVTCWELKERFNQKHFRILERSIPLFALEFLKVKTKMEVEQNYRNEFISRLLLGKYNSREEITEKSRYHGLDLNLNYQVMILDISSVEKMASFDCDDLEMQEMKNQLMFKIKQEIHHKAIVTSWNDQIVLLYPFEENQTISERVKKIGTDLQNMVYVLFPQLIVTVGAGRFYQGIEGIQQAYREALEAIQIGSEVYGAGAVIHFDDLGIYRILCKFPMREELESIYQETIMKLAEYDKSRNQELISTLSQYFKHNANQLETAEAMNIHVNTLKYRLQKIEQLTGISLIPQKVDFIYN